MSHLRNPMDDAIISIDSPDGKIVSIYLYGIKTTYTLQELTYALRRLLKNRSKYVPETYDTILNVFLSALALFD